MRDSPARRGRSLRRGLEGSPRRIVGDRRVGLEADPAGEAASGGDPGGLERALRREDVAPSVYGRERFPARGHGGQTRERERAARRGGRSGNCVPPRWVGCENLATSSLDGRRATHLNTISKRRGWIWRASSPSLASRTSRRVMFSISIASPARDVGRDATAVSHSAPRGWNAGRADASRRLLHGNARVYLRVRRLVRSSPTGQVRRCTVFLRSRSDTPCATVGMRAGIPRQLTFKPPVGKIRNVPLLRVMRTFSQISPRFSLRILRKKTGIDRRIP